MKIQLIQGEFSNRDALELITKMIHAKITYHENRIHAESSEEDMKYREGKIKQLQKELYEFRAGIEGRCESVKMHATIEIEPQEKAGKIGDRQQG
jgi:hypothetical protein